MNRSERRRLKREDDIYEANTKWYNGLPVDKKIFIEQNNQLRINDSSNLFAGVICKCILSSIDDMFDMSVYDIEQLLKDSDIYTEDYKNYLEKEGDEGYMIIKNEEFINKVKIKTRKYINGKMEKSKGLKLLKNEFNIPYAELSDIWLECKSEKFPEYESCHEVTKKKVSVDVVENKEIEKPKERVPVKKHKVAKITAKERVPVEKIKSKEIEEKKPIEKYDTIQNYDLQVIKTLKKIKGKYGTYLRSEDGVEMKEKLYPNAKMVEKEKFQILEKNITKIKSTKDKMEKLKNTLQDLKDTLEDLEYNNNIDEKKYDELIKVFDF